MIIDLNSCKLINREDRYIALDSYTYLGNSYSILPKYIDINYEARQEELDRRFQSIQTVVGSAGITLIGQHGEVDYSLREYPLFTVNRLLHTMIDRVDSMELFRKWLRWYRDLGFDAISIAINSKKSLSSITNIVHLEAQRVFDAVLVSNWPFEHRYKPSFSEIPYVGNPEVLQHFHSYAPGNFHHIQHIAMRLATVMIHAKAVGYFDIDEFLHPHKNATEIWNFLSPTCHACLYFLNHWHYMASESPFIFTPIGEPNQKTKRSKYITIPEYTLDYGIHFPCMDNGTSSNVAGRIIHIINLSTYSKRERLSFKAASQYCDAALNDNHKGRPFYSI